MASRRNICTPHLKYRLPGALFVAPAKNIGFPGLYLLLPLKISASRQLFWSSRAPEKAFFAPGSLDIHSGHQKTFRGAEITPGKAITPFRAIHLFVITRSILTAGSILVIRTHSPIILIALSSWPTSRLARASTAKCSSDILIYSKFETCIYDLLQVTLR